MRYDELALLDGLLHSLMFQDGKKRLLTEMSAGPCSRPSYRVGVDLDHELTFHCL
jgi:hypothetical protein